MPSDRVVLLASALLLLAPSGISQKAPRFTNQFPLSFEPNLGQGSTSASYLSHQSAYTIRINKSSLTFALPSARKPDGSTNARAVSLRWANADRNAQIAPEGPLPGISNYLLGQDPSRWVTRVPHFSELKESGILPGVDLRYHSSASGDLEYDLVVMPGVDLSALRLQIEGADQVRICEAGALCLRSGGTELRQLAPTAYEMRDGAKIALQAGYVLKSNNEVSFAVPRHLSGYQLVLDPVIQYATYLGGSKVFDPDNCGAWSTGLTVAVDTLGNAFVAGQTDTTDFPVTPGAFMTGGPNTSGCLASAPEDYVTKFSTSGQLLYSTYLSGDNGMALLGPGKALAVDGEGNAYLTGSTFGSFPITPSGYQQTCAKAPCAFLAKLSDDGSELLYSTYFGSVFDSTSWGQSIVNNYSVAIGPTGDAYIAGATNDTAMPTTARSYQTVCPQPNPGWWGPCASGFAARFNTNLSGAPSLVFSTYLGVATGLAEVSSIAVDSYGDAYVVGLTTADFPYEATFGSGAGIQQIYGIPAETFVMKLAGSDGWAPRAATLLRGVSGAGIAVDADLNTFVAGTASSLMATTSGAFQTKFGGGDPTEIATDGFVSKLDSSGYHLLYSTFLGGSGSDVLTDLAVNSAGMAFVTGRTDSTNFPIRPNAFKKTITPYTSNAFVTALNANGKSAYYSSYLGGSMDFGIAVAVDPVSNAWVVGNSSDLNFPVTSNAFQPAAPGIGGNAFVAKIATAADLSMTLKPNVTTIAKNGVATFNAQVANLGPDQSANVVVSDPIPAGMAYVGVTAPSGISCKQPKAGATKGTLQCTTALLASGQAKSLGVHLRAVGSKGTKITNTVSATAQTQDLWPANNSAAATVTIH